MNIFLYFVTVTSGENDVSHLLVRRFPSGIDSTMANSLFHVLSHAGARILLVQTGRKVEMQEEKH